MKKESRSHREQLSDKPLFRDFGCFQHCPLQQHIVNGVGSAVAVEVCRSFLYVGKSHLILCITLDHQIVCGADLAIAAEVALDACCRLFHIPSDEDRG